LTLRLQALLAALLAAAPLGLLLLWSLLAGPDLVDPLVAWLLALAGSLFVALLWSRDVRAILAGRTPLMPAHSRIGAALARAGEAAGSAAALAETRAEGVPALLEALPDPVLALDEQRTLVRANQAARALFGAAGELPALLRHPALVDGLAKSASGSAHQAVQQAEIALSVPVERLLQAQLVPVDLAIGQAQIRTLVVLRDRTREAALERMRADFVANASHELRTPLASLIGFVETLRGPAEGDLPAQRRFLAIMHEQAERMRRLLDDLLSLSQIEMIEHAAPTGEVHVGRVVRQAADGIEPRLASRSQRLALDIEEQIPPIQGDADQLSQVAMNLLDNAVKYGSDGGVIGVSVKRVAPATGTARGARRPGIAIAVSDDGAGIPPEHLPRLTERFYRVDAGRSRAVGGTGLGLAIVKHIVNRHRGRLEIESVVGQGSTFTVWLPEGSGQ
jgi:two-component system phosphate regulon sensor histidine kinase PhoR